jgi:hypothetical protein
MKRAARTRCSPPTADRLAGRWARGRSVGKRSEPHDRQRDATSPRPPSGGNRRGGAKPRGRNVTPEMVSLEPKQAATPAGVDARRHVDGGAGESAIGRRPRGASRKVVNVRLPRRIPREEAESGQGGRHSALTGSEDQEGPRGPVPSGTGTARRFRKPSKTSPVTGQGQGGSGEGQRPATQAPRATNIILNR